MGDELNHLMQLDGKSMEKALLFAPETNIFTLNSLDEPDGIINIPKPVTATFSNWLSTPSGDNESIRSNMLQFT